MVNCLPYYRVIFRISILYDAEYSLFCIDGAYFSPLFPKIGNVISNYGLILYHGGSSLATH
ncbi:hypothetical protein ES703_113083 [subsurface metagenome]